MLNPVKPVHVEAVTDLEEGQRLDGWRGEQTTPSRPQSRASNASRGWAGAAATSPRKVSSRTAA